MINGMELVLKDGAEGAGLGLLLQLSKCRFCDLMGRVGWAVHILSQSFFYKAAKV